LTGIKITSTRNQNTASWPGPHTDPDHQYAANVVKAAERVGKTWIEELQWLADFAQKTPDQLTHELSDPESLLVYEVGWFSRMVSIAFTKMDRAWIVDAAGSLERELRSLLERGHAIFHATEVTFVLNRRTDESWKRSGRASKLEAFHRAENPVTRFLLSAYRLLELEGVRLRLCAVPDCRRIFVRKKRGIFCSKKCSRREQTRRYRERHPEHAKIRQRQYYERKSKRKRAAVIISRKPRRNRPK
jgi:CGNR zinc finger